MIKKIHLHNIGPAPDLEAEFGERLNVITGDNGLGKTFLLDACWYALTGTWANREFYPLPNVPKDDPPFIKFTSKFPRRLNKDSESYYDFRTKIWELGLFQGEPAETLVIYARIDGGFSVWEPLRYDTGKESPHLKPTPYQFKNNEVWYGLPEGARLDDILCNGLVRDVESWHVKKNGAIELLQKVLAELSSDNGSGRLQIGESMPIGAVDTPTLVTHNTKIPVTQAGAGTKRVLSLAYLLVWAWEAHKRAAKEAREEPARRMVLLFDEVEAHLHPKWQKVFLPALMKVANEILLQGKADSIQVIATTHAPLVLGSVETLWDQEKDQLFDFDLEGNEVELEAIDFAKHGSAENWLGSDSFDLADDYPGYSVQAQEAMRRADAFMLNYPQTGDTPKDEMEEIDTELHRVLGGEDEYWPYWAPYRDKRRNVR